MLKYMRRAGVTSDMLYTAGIASIGISVASWIMSLAFEEAGTSRADHWGLFVGEWAPTFMAMGIAMRIEEEWAEEEERRENLRARRRRSREEMPVG